MQRAIWFVVFFIILAGGYYWLFIDQERVNEMGKVKEKRVTEETRGGEKRKTWKPIGKSWVLRQRPGRAVNIKMKINLLQEMICKVK